jgi:hypothetical protein
MNFEPGSAIQMLIGGKALRKPHKRERKQMKHNQRSLQKLVVVASVFVVTLSSMLACITTSSTSPPCTNHTSELLYCKSCKANRFFPVDSVEQHWTVDSGASVGSQNLMWGNLCHWKVSTGHCQTCGALVDPVADFSGPRNQGMDYDFCP